MTSAANGKNYVVSLHAEKTSVADAAEFYEKALKDAGLEPNKIETTAGKTKIFVLTGKNDKIDTSLQIMKQADKDGAMVTLAWREKPAK